MPLAAGFLALLAAAALAVSIPAAALAGPAGGGAETPPELERLRSLKGGKEAVPGPPRDRAQREAAFSSSVQAGAAWRYARILEERVVPNEAALDRLFDFGPLMIRKGDVFVLPPVAVGAGRAVRLEEGDMRARGQEKSYRLAERARMALGPPDWREYLVIDMPEPPETHPSILPASLKEIRIWRERVDRGWKTGVEEAEQLFRTRSALLARDYAGMLLYLELRGENLVSAPEVTVSGKARSGGDDELYYMLTDYGLVGTGAFVGADEDGDAGGSGAKVKGSAAKGGASGAKEKGSGAKVKGSAAKGGASGAEGKGSAAEGNGSGAKGMGAAAKGEASGEERGRPGLDAAAVSPGDRGGAR